MPTNTYVALDKITLGSNASSVTFNSINQSYTDLVIVINGKHSANQNEAYGLQFNGDTGSNYSTTYLLGSGTAALSGRVSSQTRAICGWLNATDIGTYINHIQNYSNTTTYKTVLSRGAQTDSDTYLSASVSLWRSTSAITSITVIPDAASLASGMTFSLYGIAAASVGAKATGGTVYSDSQYYYHVFGSTGTFTPLQSLATEMLVVGGGGGASGGTNGVNFGSAGASGIVSYSSQTMSNATAYTCTVGGGGAGAIGAGSNGTSSSITGTGITTVTATAGNGAGTGRTGGSNASFSGGTGAIGFNGGGGAGSAANGSDPNGGAGTGSYSTWLTATGLGVSGFIAGGGGGGSTGIGGSGGGGNGGTAGTNTPGATNTGSGGGGGTSAVAGGAGGSGIVIVRYAK